MAGQWLIGVAEKLAQQQQLMEVPIPRMSARLSNNSKPVIDEQQYR